ncbi:unnamed protein product [Chrysoparadoxa australica]
MLERIANQVEPICKAHDWEVGHLVEFYPSHPGMLGVNINRGMEIKVRLRPHSSPNTLMPYETCLGTMLHELCHNKISAHSASFYKLLDELNAECTELMRQGITGSNMPYDGVGHALGGGYPAADAKAAVRRAAEKRQKLGAVMPSGGQKLGGGGTEPADLPNLKERALAAAERRKRDEERCGSYDKDFEEEAPVGADEHGKQRKGVAGSSAGAGWACDACTLVNEAAAKTCAVCGAVKKGAAGGRQKQRDVRSKQARERERKRHRSTGSGRLRHVTEQGRWYCRQAGCNFLNRCLSYQSTPCPALAPPCHISSVQLSSAQFRSFLVFLFPLVSVRRPSSVLPAAFLVLKFLLRLLLLPWLRGGDLPKLS